MARSEFSIVEVDPADEVVFRAWFDLCDGALAAGRIDPPVRAFAEQVLRYQHSSRSYALHPFAALVGEAMVGAGQPRAAVAGQPRARDDRAGRAAGAATTRCGLGHVCVRAGTRAGCWSYQRAHRGVCADRVRGGGVARRPLRRTPRVHQPQHRDPPPAPAAGRPGQAEGVGDRGDAEDVRLRPGVMGGCVSAGVCRAVRPPEGPAHGRGSDGGPRLRA